MLMFESTQLLDRHITLGDKEQKNGQEAGCKTRFRTFLSQGRGVGMSVLQAYWIHRTTPDPVLPNCCSPHTTLDALMSQADGTEEKEDLDSFIESKKHTFRKVRGAPCVAHNK